MLKVRDLLEEFGLDVLAGEGAVDAEVRGVQVSDLLDPTPWLSPGELLLTSGLQLEGGQRFGDYIARLAAKDVAALGMARQSLREGSPSAVRVAAAEADLPLFEVPPKLPFIALARSFSNRMHAEHEDRLARSIAVQETLEQGTRARTGLGALVTALSTALDTSVLVCDARGHPLVMSTAGDPPDSTLLAELGSNIRGWEGRLDLATHTVSVGERGCTAVGVSVPWEVRPTSTAADSDPRAGVWLVAMRERASRVDDDLLALRQAVPLVALELLRHRVARDRERQVASAALAAILHENESGDEVERKLARFELIDAVAAIVVEARDEAEWSVARVESALATNVRRESAVGLVASSGRLAVALIPGLPDDELFALADRVGIGIASSLGSAVGLGVGRAVPVRDAAMSVEEARFALEAKGTAARPAARPALGPDDPSGRVATYKDLGSYQLLLALQGHEALRRFCDSILGPIEAMESSYAGELLRSLQVFIETNGHWERAARLLFCHRHTLRYRIRKVEELTGRDLDAATDRIEFYLALRARTLLP